MTTIELKAFRKEVARGVSQLKDERLLKKIQRLVEKEMEPKGLVPGLSYNYEERMALVDEEMDKIERGESVATPHEEFMKEVRSWR